MKEQFAIGIDVGGSALKCGAVAEDGRLMYCFTEAIKKENGEAGIIEQIAACIAQAAAVVQDKGGVVCGTGIGFPGIVENDVVIGGADNLPGFEQLPLGRLLQERTGYRTLVDNDANMMGMGEWIYGAAKGCSDIVFLTVGTGIGGALIINNQLYGGYRNRGTELGHIIIRQGGIACSCGGRGCFEAYASVAALIGHYQLLKQDVPDPVDGRHIVEGYFRQEDAAVAAMACHFDYMATGIAGYINIFSPQKVVLGGGISEAGDFYIREIAARVAQLAMPAASQQTTLVAAALGNKAGLQGCAAKVFQTTAGSAPAMMYNHSTN